MPGKNFFEEEETTEETVEEAQTFKLGDKEYNQDELSELVGLGNIAKELETKWNTKIDRVYPDYTKATQALSDERRKREEAEEKLTQFNQSSQTSTGELTAEQKAEARRQLENLGYGETQFRNIVREEMEANRLLTDVQLIVDNAKENDNIATTPEQLLKFMADEGVKNPSKAYKLMYEEELDKVREQKLANLKPQGMFTTTSSQAGAKSPRPVQITKSNLNSLVQQALGGE